MGLAQQQRRLADPGIEAAHQQNPRATALCREKAQQLDPVGAGHRQIKTDDVGAHLAVQQGEALRVRREMHLVAQILRDAARSEEHTSELKSLMRISYAVYCWKKKTNTKIHNYTPNN